MPEPDKPDNLAAGVIKQLVQETGVTEAQAADLVTLIGINWSSLVREARILNRNR